MPDEFSQVLHGCNEQVLDGLLPQPTPPSALKAMTVSRIVKTALDEVSSA
jgi:hypothetical protein